MKQIPLNNSPQFALVDDCHYGLLSVLTWRAQRGRGENLYAVSACAAPVGMHVVVAALAGIGGPMVDHRSGDGLDNQLENLRAADHAQNAWNSIRQLGVSGIPGVHRNRNGWAVRFDHRGKRMYFGTHASLSVAAQIAIKARVRLRGEYVAAAELDVTTARLRELEIAA